MAWAAQNLPSALPIWDNWRFQTFRMPFCSGNPGVPLYARHDRILPWIVMGPTAAPDYVYLVNEAGTNALDITALLTILTGSEGGNDYVYCEGSTDINQATSCTEYTGWNGTTWPNTPGDNTWGTFIQCDAQYYLEFKFGSSRYYSELFTIRDFPEFSDNPMQEDFTFVRIDAATNCMIDTIPPLGVQKLFVPGYTVEPEYPVDETVSTNGQKQKKILAAMMNKRYKLRFFAPESVADFCATLPLYSTVTITDQYGLQSAVRDIEFKPSWGEDNGQGCACLVELTFTRDFVSYTNCC